MSPEKRLSDAHARVAMAERALIAATATAAKATDFAPAVEAEVGVHAARDQALAAERAEGLKQSLKSGGAPKFVASPTTKERIARIDAEARRAAAQRARDELNADAQEAKAGFDTARAELEAAARGVLSEEAESYAAKAVELELEAQSKRAQLEAELRNSASGWGSNSAAKLMIESERAKARGAADLSPEAPKGNAALDAARSIAAKVVVLELEALSDRIKLEAAVRSGTLGWGKQIALSPLAQRLAQENLSTAIAVKNSPEWAAANQAAEGWRTRHVELLRRSDAQPCESEDGKDLAANRHGQTPPAVLAFAGRVFIFALVVILCAVAGHSAKAQLGVGSPGATCPMGYTNGDGCPQAPGNAQVIFPNLLTTAPVSGQTLPYAHRSPANNADPRWGDSGYSPSTGAATQPSAASTNGRYPGRTIPGRNIPAWANPYDTDFDSGSMDPSQKAHAKGANWDFSDPNAAALGRAASIDTSKTLTSNVTNTINVTSTDPHEAAAMVALHLDRTANDVTRNLQGAVQ